MEITYELTNLAEVAEKILQSVQANVLLFYGKMGVGKTTLIKEMCRQLEVEDVASSPSFGIVNEYHSPGGPIYHFDFYRINDPEEALDFGVDEYLYSGDRVFIEWPEKIQDLLPEDALKIHLEKDETGLRKIRFLNDFKKTDE